MCEVKTKKYVFKCEVFWKAIGMLGVQIETTMVIRLSWTLVSGRVWYEFRSFQAILR